MVSEVDLFLFSFQNKDSNKVVAPGFEECLNQGNIDEPGACAVPVQISPPEKPVQKKKKSNLFSKLGLGVPCKKGGCCRCPHEKMGGGGGRGVYHSLLLNPEPAIPLPYFLQGRSLGIFLGRGEGGEPTGLLPQGTSAPQLTSNGPKPYSTCGLSYHPGGFLKKKIFFFIYLINYFQIIISSRIRVS